jgi:hypothetical protein
MATKRARVGERRWPMAAAVLLAGTLRLFLPSQLRLDDARPVALVVLAVLMVALIAGDPGRIDRQATWLRVLTAVLIGVITVANAGSSVRLVYAIIKTEPFTNDPNILLVSGAVIWLTNIIAFGLWYWDLDRGGAAARALGAGISPAFMFPEMSNPEFVRDGWYPSFVGEAHDDGRGDDLTSRRNPRGRPGGEHPEVGPAAQNRPRPVRYGALGGIRTLAF